MRWWPSWPTSRSVVAEPHRPADAADDAPLPGDLAGLRAAIDAVDAQVLALVSRRARLAHAVGELKAREGSPVLRPEREAQILRRQVERNPGPLPAEAIEAIWREIISACRALERRLRVAYLGPAGTFSEAALRQRFGSAVDAVPCATIDEVFRTVEAQACDFGVVPVENSTEGSVSRTLDRFQSTPLAISAEVSLPVRHCILTVSGRLDGVRRVLAHPQALAQCAGWLDRHLPGVERAPVSSNAEGARLAALDASIAAIAGEGAAEHHAVRVVEAGIQDEPNNRTRFAVVGRYRCAPSGEDQTTLIVSVPDRAGAIHAMLEPLARHGVSMKRLESRPARHGDWEYFFHIDLLGHADDPPVAAALQEMRAGAQFFKIVGAYPRARA